MATRKISDYKDELSRVKHHVSFDDIEVGKVYHIPPIVSIERMDIKIVKKTEDKIVFNVLGSTDASDKDMHKTSILARFLVPRYSF